MKTRLMLLYFLVPIIISAQSISLDSCLNMAEEAYPLKDKEELLKQSVEIRNKITSIAYMPSIKLNAQATWQTDVTMLEIDNPMFADMLPEINKDQYKVYAEINQTIWDGGVTGSKKDLENAGLQTNLQQTNVDIYKYKEQLVDLYFAALSLQKQVEILQMKEWQIDNVISDVRAAVDNDVALQSQLDILLAEKMILNQNITSLQYEIKSLIKIFSEYCNTDFDESLTFLVPTPDLNLDAAMSRPELLLFDYSSKQILAGKDLLKSARNPKVFAFAQAGYGRPGLNMMSNDFDPYAIVGAKFVWTPWEWNKTKYEMELLDIKSDIVGNSQDVFVLHQNAKLEAQSEKIAKINALSEQDQTILELRESITQSYLAQLNNGVIKSSDYLNVLNDENSQRLNMELHQLMLYEAIVKYNLLKGEIYE